MWSAAQSHESLLRQKARSRWIKEGDFNSKFFHRFANSKCRSSTLRGVVVNDVWVDEPGRVKEETYVFFKNRFQEVEWVRPKLDGSDLKKLDSSITSDCRGHSLKKKLRTRFGSDKTPGPDGLNFIFIKEF